MIFLNALDEIFALIIAAILYWKNIKNTLRIPQITTLIKNLLASLSVISKSLVIPSKLIDEKDLINGFIEDKTTTSLKLINKEIAIIEKHKKIYFLGKKNINFIKLGMLINYSEFF